MSRAIVFFFSSSSCSFLVDGNMRSGKKRIRWNLKKNEKVDDLLSVGDYVKVTDRVKISLCLQNILHIL